VSTDELDGPKIFAAQLKKFREIRGMTQSELGAKAGMGAASISHFETGQRGPAIESLVKVADALDVSVDTLLGRGNFEQAQHIDPIFLKASQADNKTLEMVKKVTQALLSGSNS